MNENEVKQWLSEHCEEFGYDIKGAYSKIYDKDLIELLENKIEKEEVRKELNRLHCNHDRVSHNHLDKMFETTFNRLNIEPSKTYIFKNSLSGWKSLTCVNCKYMIEKEIEGTCICGSILQKVDGEVRINEENKNGKF